MENWPSEMILDQMDTLVDFYSTELPNLLLNPRIEKEGIDFNKIRYVYAIGDGDSLFAARSVEYLFKSISNVEYYAVPAYQFLTYDLLYFNKEKANNSLIIGISASGGSKYVIQAISEANRLYPNIKTLSLCGTPNSKLEKAAQFHESVKIEEKGRTPGIRTYGASIIGLISLAFSINEKSNYKYSRKELTKYIVNKSKDIKKGMITINKIGEMYSDLYDGSYITCLGSGPTFGTAGFSAAKIVESSGIYSYAQDLEEWNHVESFSYPTTSLLIVFANPGPTYRRAKSLIDSALKLGHKIIVITPEVNNDKFEHSFITFGEYDDLLSPLFDYIPISLFSFYLSKKMNRDMFMTDRR